MIDKKTVDKVHVELLNIKRSLISDIQMLEDSQQQSGIIFAWSGYYAIIDYLENAIQEIDNSIESLLGSVEDDLDLTPQSIDAG